MKAVILDGSNENDLTGQHVRTALTAELEARGWEIEHVQLCETKIGNCAGDFFCWIRNPGLCNVNDANRLIAASIANCQLLVYLTPITFGGYSSTLKKWWIIKSKTSYRSFNRSMARHIIKSVILLIQIFWQSVGWISPTRRPNPYSAIWLIATPSTFTRRKWSRVWS